MEVVRLKEVGILAEPYVLRLKLTNSQILKKITERRGTFG